MNILFVDDEEGTREQAKIFLERENSEFEVQGVPSAEHALEVLKEGTSSIDVIVSDHQMPDMSGIEFLERFREESFDIPFIILTGKGREEVAMKALNLGADRYLRKSGTASTQYELLAQAITQEYERWEIEKKFEENKRKIEELHRVASELMSCESEDEAYEITIEAAEEILDYDYCGIAEKIDGEYEIRALSSNLSFEDVSEQDFYGGSLDEDILTDEEDLLIDDTDEAEIDITGPLLDNQHYRSIISLPVKDIGVFQAISEIPGYFDDEDLKMAELLVSHLSNSINRIRSKKELRKKEKLYRKIFETTKSAIALLDEDLDIHLSNESFKTLTEYYWKDLKGVNILDLVVKNDQEMVKEHSENVKENPDVVPNQFPVRVLTDNRSARPVMMTIGYTEEEEKYVVSLITTGDEE